MHNKNLSNCANSNRHRIFYIFRLNNCDRKSLISLKEFALSLNYRNNDITLWWVIKGEIKFWREKAVWRKSGGQIAILLGWMRGMALAYGYQRRVHWAPTSFCSLRVSEEETEKGEGDSKVEGTKREESEAGEKPTRRSGFGLGCSGVALPCGGHKGSRRILILVSPNLLTYLTYPRSSRRIHPAPWDNSIPSPLFSNATTSAPFICLSLFFFFSSPLFTVSLSSLAASSRF